MHLDDWLVATCADVSLPDDKEELHLAEMLSRGLPVSLAELLQSSLAAEGDNLLVVPVCVESLKH